ncbi:MAG: glutathione synthase [bacterium]
MTTHLAIVMDPIESIKPKKDSSLAMLLAAQARGWKLSYLQQEDLFTRDGSPYARMTDIRVKNSREEWFRLGETNTLPLETANVILMRKDPPFNMEYIYSTYILELAAKRGSLVVNSPQSLRDINEKFSTTWFPQCAPEHVVTRETSLVRQFLDEQEDIIVKPLDGMGGSSIFRIRKGDPNTSVILETLLGVRGEKTLMAQRFLPEYKEGDKRILLINGRPVPYALARIPKAGEGRANLAAGATGIGVKLTDRDHWICEQIGDDLRKRGVVFAGIDVIGDYLTEINVTSPTCIRELDEIYQLDIAGDLMGEIAELIESRPATS